MVGNLCVASPASDLVPALLVFGAKLKVSGVDSSRTIPIEDFFVGVKCSSLQPGEIVTEVSIPKLPHEAGSTFLKLTRTGADLAKVNVAVMIVGIEGACIEAKMALGSVAPTPIRARKAEELLKGQKIDRDLINTVAHEAAKETKPISDLRSTEEYRKQMTQILIKRAKKPIFAQK